MDEEFGVGELVQDTIQQQKQQVHARICMLSVMIVLTLIVYLHVHVDVHVRTYTYISCLNLRTEHLPQEVICREHLLIPAMRC